MKSSLIVLAVCGALWGCTPAAESESGHDGDLGQQHPGLGSTEVVRNYKLPYPNGTNYLVVQYPHAYSDQLYNAIDMGLPRNTDIVAMRSGTISALVDSYGDMAPGGTCQVSSCNDTTNFLIIQHDDGNESSYLHLAQGSATALGLHVGDRICAGQVLGKVGLNGYTSGPHVHVSVQAGGSSGDRNSAWNAMFTKATKVIYFDELNGPVVQGNYYTSRNAPSCSTVSDALQSGRSRVARDLDGRMEVMMLGTDGRIHRNAHACVGCGWVGWSTLSSPTPLISEPALATDLDGHLDALALGSDKVMYKAWQNGPNGAWTPFYAMAGATLSTEATVARNQNGKLEAFARGTDGLLKHSFQLDVNGAWSDWYDMGNGGAPIAGIPAVAMNQDGRLEVFGRGTDNTLFHMWQLSPGGTWSGWYSLGGNLATSPTVGMNQDGRLEVFATDPSGAVVHTWQNAAGGSWSPVYALGGTVASALSVGRNSDGRLELFALGSDKAVYHAWQQAPNGSWSSFYSLGGSLKTAVAVGVLSSGSLELFGVGTDGAMDHAWQSNGAWSAVYSLGVP